MFVVNGLVPVSQKFVDHSERFPALVVQPVAGFKERSAAFYDNERLGTVENSYQRLRQIAFFGL
ncbi:MAG TPA: hypothetical protein VGE31_02110 [Candidatus Paceibacterota bacterium]